jgi:glycosyltransferase involved in cell wall biosynthesis
MRPAVVNAHSLSVLPVAAVWKVIGSCALAYDTHEIETETLNSRGARQALSRLVERALIRRADIVITVNESIADWYRETYGLASGRVRVLRNAPSARFVSIARGECGHSNGTEKPGDFLELRLACGIPAGELLFLYQGVVGDGRGTRMLVEAFGAISGRHVVFLSYGDDETVRWLRTQAGIYNNVHFVPAVSPDSLPYMTAQADVGLCIIEPLCLSYSLSLPNKLLEYLLSGVPVLGSDLPEFRRLITQDRGWLIEPESSQIKAFVEELSVADVRERKQALQATPVAISWESDFDELVDFYSGYLTEPSTASG